MTSAPGKPGAALPPKTAAREGHMGNGVVVALPDGYRAGWGSNIDNHPGGPVLWIYGPTVMEVPAGWLRSLGVGRGFEAMSGYGKRHLGVFPSAQRACDAVVQTHINNPGDPPEFGPGAKVTCPEERCQRTVRLRRVDGKIARHPTSGTNVCWTSGLDFENAKTEAVRRRYWGE